MTAAAALALLLATAPADPLGDTEAQQHRLFDKIAPSVVFISDGTSFGSGFFVAADGLILTNAHVVQGRERVDVVLHDGRRMTGTVVERAVSDIDLALVHIPVLNAPVPPMEGLSAVRVGSWVGSVGHGRGGIWTFNTGMISNIYPDGAERPVFQTQIPLNPGNSGGPIFDRRGRVVGIVTAGLEKAVSINFGIAMEIARRTLGRLAASCECLIVDAPAGVPIFVDNAMVGPGPRAVVPALAGKSYEAFAVIGGQMVRAQVKYPESRYLRLGPVPAAAASGPTAAPAASAPVAAPPAGR